MNMLPTNLVKRSVIGYNLISLFLCFDVSASDSRLSAEHSKTLKEYKISENFKGFFYSAKFKNDKKTLYIKNILMGGESKRFSGLWINTDSRGVIQEIGPVFEKVIKQFDVIVWAIDNYYERRINFDTLWCVVHAANDKKIDNKLGDRSLMLFILETINNSPRGEGMLNRTKVKLGDECWLVISEVLPNIKKEILLSDLLLELLK